MNYKITIGIPAYNASEYIKRTLGSVLNQSFNSIQVLIVDDCSTDNTCNIISEIQINHPKGGNIKLLIQKQNQGVSAARNRIIKEAEGEYLYFMDSDDTIEPNTISLLYDKIQEHKADIAFASYRKLMTDKNGNETIENNIYPDIFFNDNTSFGMYAFRKMGGIQSAPVNYLVKLSKLRDNHLKFIKANYWEDATFVMEMATYMDRVVLCHNITYNYICRENSLSHYQARNMIPKSEIEGNMYVVECMKSNAYKAITKKYGADINFVALSFAFYTICGILGKRNIIKPKISFSEMISIIHSQITFKDIMAMKRRKCFHVLFWTLSKFPAFITIPIIWSMGKVKHVI